MTRLSTGIPCIDNDPQLQEIYRSAFVTTFPWWKRALYHIAAYLDRKIARRKQPKGASK